MLSIPDLHGISRLLFPYCESLSFGFNISILLTGFLEELRFAPIYTDASNVAFGSYLATVDGEPVRGMFCPVDVNMSSTHRELKAVFYVFKSYADRLKHQRVIVFVDNMGASHILMVGSYKPHLQQIAIDIFSVCLSFGISLDSQWLPREENARTDLLSRFIDRDD